MDFDAKEINEYISDSDGEEQEGEEEQKQPQIREESKNGSDAAFASSEKGSELDFEAPGKNGVRVSSMIFKPFKPGKQHPGMRTPSLTV